MTSTHSPNKYIEEPASGDYNNAWAAPVNGNWTLIDTAFGGSTLLNSTGSSGTVTLTYTQYQPLSLLISGTPTGALTYSVPSGVGGQWTVNNATSGTYASAVYIASAAGGSSLLLPNGYTVIVSCDGTSTGMRFSNNPPAAAGGSAGQIQFNTAGLVNGSANLTWNNSTNALGVTGSFSATTSIAAGTTLAATTTVTAGTSVSDSIGNVRSVPQNAKTATYTLLATDAGKHISITTGGVGVPTGVFSTGDAVSIYNNSGSDQTITQNSGVTMYLGGTATTGNRTIAQHGLITILCVASNTFVIMGAGIS